MFSPLVRTATTAVTGTTLRRLHQRHAALRDLARAYACDQLAPVAAELDREGRFPEKQIKELGQLGFLSVAISEKWGGSGHDVLGLAVAVEEIARACGGTGAIVSIHNCLYVNLVDRFGTDEQKEEFLKPYTNGALGCFALSEPDAGSDVSAISTTAKSDGDFYVLNGTKSWVTSAPESGAAIVFATVDKSLKYKGITGFLIPINTAGLTRGVPDDKLGIRAASCCNIVLENVRIPKKNVIGNVGDGFKIAMMQLDVARIGIAAQAVGIGQAALDLAVEYASQRQALGQPINQLQAVKIRIANMAIRLEAARLLVHRAAEMSVAGDCTTKESAMAKLSASKAANFNAFNAMQILGGMGYVTNMPAERYYRDARITEIYGGVTDIQKLVIADSIIRQQ